MEETLKVDNHRAHLKKKKDRVKATESKRKVRNQRKVRLSREVKVKLRVSPKFDTYEVGQKLDLDWKITQGKRKLQPSKIFVTPRIGKLTKNVEKSGGWSSIDYPAKICILQTKSAGGDFPIEFLDTKKIKGWIKIDNVWGLIN